MTYFQQKLTNDNTDETLYLNFAHNSDESHLYSLMEFILDQMRRRTDEVTKGTQSAS